MERQYDPPSFEAALLNALKNMNENLRALNETLKQMRADSASIDCRLKSIEEAVRKSSKTEKKKKN